MPSSASRRAADRYRAGAGALAAPLARRRRTERLLTLVREGRVPLTSVDDAERALAVLFPSLAAAPRAAAAALLAALAGEEEKSPPPDGADRPILPGAGDPSEPPAIS